MKKELGKHYLVFLIVFAIASLFNGWIQMGFYKFWLGGIVGTVLPDIDHLIYSYFLKPQDLTSLRIKSLLDKGKILRTWDLIATTESERTSLIFHSAHFQIIFVVFAFFIVTSSGSLVGKGIALSFLIHLLVDQIMDYRTRGGIANWFKKIPYTFDDYHTRIWIIANIAALVILIILL